MTLALMSLEMVMALLPGLIIGLTLHEFGHAWAASRLGDDWPRRQGRVSLNPFRHLSPLGTLALLVLPFGWAKPVPVNLYNFRNPRRDYLLTSLAGPAMNLLVVLACLGLMQLTRQTYALGLANAVWVDLVHGFLVMVLLINTILCVFNLIPMPPLDGSKIWPFLFRRAPMAAVGKTGRYATILLLVLLWTDSLGPLFSRTFNTVMVFVPTTDARRFHQIHEKGWGALRAEQTEVALVAFDEALAINPDSPDALLGRACVRRDVGDWAGALADAERIAHWPLYRQDPGFHDLRAEALAGLGRSEEADQAAAEAQRLREAQTPLAESPQESPVQP